jgi:replicative DNA helicase
MYRQDYYDREDQKLESDHRPDRAVPVEIIIGKNRNGPVGVVELAFQQVFTRFSSYQRGDP